MAMAKTKRTAKTKLYDDVGERSEAPKRAPWNIEIKRHWRDTSSTTVTDRERREVPFCPHGHREVCRGGDSCKIVSWSRICHAKLDKADARYPTIR
jgi:hypothetical protein